MFAIQLICQCNDVKENNCARLATNEIVLVRTVINTLQTQTLLRFKNFAVSRKI